MKLEADKQPEEPTIAAEQHKERKKQRKRVAANEFEARINPIDDGYAVDGEVRKEAEGRMVKR